MTTELFSNNAATTLTSSPTTGATSFTVASSTGFPAAVTGTSQFRVIIGTEIITVTNVAGTTWTCVATTAAHTSADVVTHILTTAGLGNFVDGKIATQATMDSSTYAPTLGPRPVYLDAYNAFFLSAGAWVATQGTTGTTLTAQATAGASVMAVTSGASFVNGTSIITNPGAATQQIYKVTAGGGTTSLTVTPNIVTTLASGATILPLWTNTTHLTNPEGMSSWGYWAVNAKNADGSYVLTDPGPSRPVVLLGDSWAAQLGTNFATHVHTRFPSAVVVNVGVLGNKSADMIARFATDVPTNASFVFINEPGVNDIAGGVLPETIAANLETLVSLIRGIGATPIITGMVPLFDYPGQSAAQSTALIGQTSTGTQFPAASTSALLKRINASVSAYSFGIGAGVQPFMTGVNNTAVGYYAQRAITTGNNNTAVGALAQNVLTTGASNMALGNAAQAVLSTGGNNTAVGDTAQHALTTGANNTAVGQATQYVLSSGNHNIAIGALAQFSATTPTGCTAIGHQAQYSPGGVIANATTNAFYQTSIGYQSGAGSTGFCHYITTIGYRTTAAANGGVAIGADSGGASATAATQDDFALGTALHKVKILGRLTVAQRTPTSGADTSGQVGDIASDDNYIYAKTSTGWKRSAITTW